MFDSKVNFLALDLSIPVSGPNPPNPNPESFEAFPIKFFKRLLIIKVKKTNQMIC
jgi:hypothetical protein